MPERCLHVLVGLPRSGKTTYALSERAPIVSPDAIRLALHGQRYLQIAEPMVWGIAQLMVAALFEAGHQYVIVDGCHNTKKRRAIWRDPRWTTTFVTIDTPAAVCLQRAEDEGDQEIVPVIRRMAEEHEPVEESEYA